jgi:hypothetical protein
MNGTHFDQLIQSSTQSRRSLVGWALAAAAGLLATPGVDGKKKRKRKGRKQMAGAPNAFGCIDVGDLCQTAAQCCSGICQGKKGRRTCRAHDVGDCAAGDTPMTCGGLSVACTASSGREGFCGTTTGNTGYCFEGGFCHPCRSDADCQAAVGGELGPTAACLQCTTCTDMGGTACATSFFPEA